jgi:hypothetical protein
VARTEVVRETLKDVRVKLWGCSKTDGIVYIYLPYKTHKKKFG